MGKALDALSPGLEKQVYEAPDIEWLEQVLRALKSAEACHGPHQVVRPFRVPDGKSRFRGPMRGPDVSFTDDVIVEQVPKVLRELELVKRDLDRAIGILDGMRGEHDDFDRVTNRLIANRRDRSLAREKMEVNRG